MQLAQAACQRSGDLAVGVHQEEKQQLLNELASVLRWNLLKQDCVLGNRETGISLARNLPWAAF